MCYVRVRFHLGNLGGVGLGSPSLGFGSMGWAWAADRRLRDLPSLAGRVKLGAAVTHRDRVGIGNKKPRHMGGAAAGCC